VNNVNLVQKNLKLGFKKRNKVNNKRLIKKKKFKKFKKFNSKFNLNVMQK
jgi:hypothetical protein